MHFVGFGWMFFWIHPWFFFWPSPCLFEPRNSSLQIVLPTIAEGWGATKAKRFTQCRLRWDMNMRQILFLVTKVIISQNSLLWGSLLENRRLAAICCPRPRSLSAMCPPCVRLVCSMCPRRISTLCPPCVRHVSTLCPPCVRLESALAAPPHFVRYASALCPPCCPPCVSHVPAMCPPCVRASPNLVRHVSAAVHNVLVFVSTGPPCVRSNPPWKTHSARQVTDLFITKQRTILKQYNEVRH